jgi:drug/metabolite transporter (DMT)-like permease
MQIITFLFLCFVWGTTWVAIKISLEGFPPFLGAMFRFSIAVILLFVYAKLNRISLRIKKKEFWIISISAFLMYPIDYGLIYWGEQYLSAGVTAIFFATFPLFTGIWVIVFFREEKFNWKKALGLIVAFIGILIVFLDQLFLTQFDKMIVYGILAVIQGALGGALCVVIVKKYLPNINHVSLSFFQMLQGVIYLALIGLFVEDINSIYLNTRVVMAVLYLGMVGSALAFALYYWLLKQLSAITMSLIIYITPIVAVIVDYFVFGEIIQLRAWLGMLVIFSGIAIVEIDKSRFNQLQQLIIKNNNK